MNVPLDEVKWLEKARSTVDTDTCFETNVNRIGNVNSLARRARRYITIRIHTDITTLYQSLSKIIHGIRFFTGRASSPNTISPAILQGTRCCSFTHITSFHTIESTTANIQNRN